MPSPVKPKKQLGQHFLTDENIAKKIVNLLPLQVEKPKRTLEIGAGTGVLTKYLLERTDLEMFVVDIDAESIAFLEQHFEAYWKNEDRPAHLISGDFLALDLAQRFDNQPLFIIGNFPYSISSQIFFKVLAHHEQVQQVVCMIQKEVAQRLAAKEGNKTYGILSVLLQTFYKIEYSFTVGAKVFNPPPKVESAVIRLVRNDRKELGCAEKLFFQVVKAGFNQRRKTLRNALKPLLPPLFTDPHQYLDKRAEQLSVTDFIALTQSIEKARQNEKI
jgi:16S rRNA (adenine1518-N6/adenine1519-N6)-dimethyltransferase